MSQNDNTKGSRTIETDADGPSSGGHRARLEAQLKELEKKSDEAIQRARELSTKAQQRFEKELEELQVRRKDLRERLDKMSKAADEDWKKVRGELEQAGDHVKNAFETVLERIKRQKKEEAEVGSRA
jgi:uncharacterized protein YpuA (DUF1002 family)